MKPGIAVVLLTIVASVSWGQSTWRGQAEVWSVASAPTEGYVAASNEFPRNSLLTVENYRSKKTIQVRVVATLPSGSAALVLLNPRAAAALDIKAGDTPLVGVRIDPTGIERPDNPDPDVNPLASKPTTVATTAEPATKAPVATEPVASPAAVAPPVAAVVDTPAPAVRPSPSSLEVVKAASTPDPALLPLPALAETPAAPEPLPVANEPEPAAPVTPGKHVFVATKEPEPVAAETPVEVVEVPPKASTESPVAPTEAPVAVTEAPSPPPAEPTPAPVETPTAAPVVEVTPEPSTAPATPEAVVSAPEPVAAPTPAVVETPAEVPVVSTPAVPSPVTPPVAVAGTLAANLPPASAWVSTPGKLEGPVLGAVAVLSGLEKGRSYVQLGAYASELDLLGALQTVKSYVPLAIYQAVGEKNPWRVMVASAPKAQLGFLMMHYRSQGFRTAAIVKG